MEVSGIVLVIALLVITYLFIRNKLIVRLPSRMYVALPPPLPIPPSAPPFKPPHPPTLAPNPPTPPLLLKIPIIPNPV